MTNYSKKSFFWMCFDFIVVNRVVTIGQKIYLYDNVS